MILSMNDAHDRIDERLDRIETLLATRGTKADLQHAFMRAVWVIAGILMAVAATVLSLL